MKPLYLSVILVICALIGCGDAASPAQNQPSTVEPLALPEASVDAPAPPSTLGDPLPDVSVDATSTDYLVDGTGGSKPTGPTPTPTKPGQAVLGPVVAADVTVYDINNLSKALCKTKTIDTDDLALAGTFDIPEGCVYDDKLYLIVVANGFDVDADDDGIIYLNDQHEEKVKVEGIFRALLFGHQMLEDHWRVSPLTELVFESAQFNINEKDNYTDVDSYIRYIQELLDYLAPLLLKEDINGDGILDSVDLILWSPSDTDKLFMPMKELKEFIQTIHSDKNRTVESITPYNGLIKHVDTLTHANKILMHGDTAIVISNNTVAFVDTHNLKQSTLVGWFATGYINKVTLTDHYLYVSLEVGTQVLELNDAHSATLVAYLPGKISPFNDGDTIFNNVQFRDPNDPSKWVSKLVAYDPANHWEPTVVIETAITSFHVENERLYAVVGDSAAGKATLNIYNLTDKATPLLLSSTPWTFKNQAGFFIDQNILYVGTNSGYKPLPKDVSHLFDTYTWASYDITSPENPQLLEKVNKLCLYPGEEIRLVHVNPEYLDDTLGNPLGKRAFKLDFYRGCEFIGRYDLKSFTGVDFREELQDSPGLVVSGNVDMFVRFIKEMFQAVGSQVVNTLWGEMQVKDAALDDRAVYLATGRHGLQIIKRPAFLE